MDKTTVRMELLKLVYTHHLGTNEAIGIAKLLEAHVFREDSEQVVLKPEVAEEKFSKASRKKAGNPDPLS